MRSKTQLILKRLIDILLGFIGLVLLTVPFAIIALAIKLNSKGPVFFRQERVGKDGCLFRLWKFRTLIHDSTRQGPQLPPAPGDPRITRTGYILRRFGLDELPQVFNVLHGEMSLVGPRPALPYQVAQYDERQRRRLFVKPGITGWALIHGRNRLTWKEKIDLDLWYVDHVSLRVYINILWRTPWVLLRSEGVYIECKDPLAGPTNNDESKLLGSSNAEEDA